jgi:hypothetical protein
MTENQFCFDGKAVPYLQPTEAYRYLGVHITLTLDWKAQLTALRETIKGRAENITACSATPDQKLQMIQRLIHPAVAYSLSTMAYTQADMATLDAIITRAVRTCYKLPKYLPSQAIVLPPEAFGLGVGSLRELYAVKAARCLTLSLNDTGRLGITTRALLKLQTFRNGQPDLRQLDRSGQYLVTIRQLAMAQAAGLDLTDKGNIYSPNVSGLAKLLSS